jgi:effector-binding domain-containing protein
MRFVKSWRNREDAVVEYQVELERVVPHTTAVLRLQATIPELPTVIPPACGEVSGFIRSSGIPHPGRNVAVYLDNVMNIEVGVEVARPFAGNERVVCSSTPAGLTAKAVHMGPYHLLMHAHVAVKKWCLDHGHALAGPSWEVYGHWNDDPAKLRTDVFWLLKEPSASPT